eukprot:3466310-Ditylum_brightwellii.AAC.1
MEWRRLVQDQSQAVCDIFTRRYGAPCRAFAKRLPHPTSPYSALCCIEPPQRLSLIHISEPTRP